MTAFEDRTFALQIKSPPASYFLKKAAGIEKGAKLPGKDQAGTVSVRQLYEIGKIKQSDQGMQDKPLEPIVKSLAASCKSLGIKVAF